MIDVSDSCDRGDPPSCDSREDVKLRSRVVTEVNGAKWVSKLKNVFVRTDAHVDRKIPESLKRPHATCYMLHSQM